MKNSHNLEEAKIKLIYNPNAGLKRKVVTFRKRTTTLEEIEDLFKQYQLVVDFEPTKKAGHATELAKKAVEDGYTTVIAAGGDGTISEVANGLVGSDVTLGILPMGTYMNIAMMLSIPNDLEKAVVLIKIGRTRKMDVGKLNRMDGEKLHEEIYFLEGAGIGFEAQFQKDFLEIEKGHLSALWNLFMSFKDYYANKVVIEYDGEKIETKSMLVTVSNGPFTGANLQLAPTAKLNDHRLTISIYKMPKFELLKHFIKLKWFGKVWDPKVKIIQAQKVKIITKKDRLVHTDARVFGTTPVEFSVVPNALQVITGFPKSKEESALVKRTVLDP